MTSIFPVLSRLSLVCGKGNLNYFSATFSVVHFKQRVIAPKANSYPKVRLLLVSLQFLHQSAEIIGDDY